MFVTEAHMLVRELCRIEVRLFLAVASSLALISSGFGQAVQSEVGREVSRIQRPTLFPMVTGRVRRPPWLGNLRSAKNMAN